jgi:hypothetical protein
MIGLPSGTRIWIAAGITDMRCYAVLPVMRNRSGCLSGKP